MFFRSNSGVVQGYTVPLALYRGGGSLGLIFGRGGGRFSNRGLENCCGGS